MTDQSCPRDELLAGLDAGALSPAEERDIRGHLTTCEVCRTALEENREAARMLRAIATPRPSQAARDRAYAAVLQAMEGGPMVKARAAEGGPIGKARAEGGPIGKTSARSAAAKPAPPSAPASWFSFRIISGGIAAAACILVFVSLQFSARNRAAEMSVATAPAPTAMADHADANARLRLAGKRTGGVDLGAKEESVPAPPSIEAMKPADTPAAASPPAPAPAAEPEQKKLALDNNAPAGGRRDADEGAKAQFAAGVDREITRAAKLNVARQILLDARVRRARSQSAFQDAKKKDDETKTNSATDPGKGGGTAPQAPRPAPKPDSGTQGLEGGGNAQGDARRETQQTYEKETKNEADKAPAKALAKDAAVTAGERYRDPQDPSRGVLVGERGKCDLFSADDFGAALITSRTPISRDNPVSMQILLRTLDAELEKEPQDPEQRVEWARRVLVLAEAAGEDTRAKAAAAEVK
ncbi:MAG TPA: hypothetical protein VFF73_03940 [Planctomycetota bacterium]|nr:hypothetical protein [Planctomycetota bacterium]